MEVGVVTIRALNWFSGLHVSLYALYDDLVIYKVLITAVAGALALADSQTAKDFCRCDAASCALRRVSVGGGKFIAL